MPISDTYVVRYLLQETSVHRGGLEWVHRDADLATLLHALAAAAARQCVRRMNRTSEASECIRESIYRRLTGMTGAAT
ncbi:MAG: hypothetical protein ABI811_02410 [Acidobacteriota bacterium]